MNDPMGTNQAEQTLNYINVKKVFDLKFSYPPIIYN